MENDSNKFWAEKLESTTATPSAKTPQTASQSWLGKPTIQTATPTLAPTPAATPAKPTYPGEPWMDEEFKGTVVYHESRNDPNARGDYSKDKHGKKIPGTDKAAGLFQLHDDYGKSAEDILKKWNRGNSGDPETDKRYREYSKRFEGLKDYKYSPNDRFDPQKSENIFRIVMQDLTNRFKAKYHREPTTLEMASMHHKGNLDIATDSDYQLAWTQSRAERAKKEKEKQAAPKK
jgi:hypothetical protein